MPITKIISGGQTGADRGGWDAALHCSIPIGGWIPKGRKAEDGVIPAKYENLQETKSSDYLVRTEANIVDSDATIVFCYGVPTGGSKRTVEIAAKHHRPCLTVNLDGTRKETVGMIVQWLRSIRTNEGVLNVAGSRESKAPSIEDRTMVWMVDVISEVNGKLFYPLMEEDDNPPMMVTE